MKKSIYVAALGLLALANVAAAVTGVGVSVGKASPEAISLKRGVNIEAWQNWVSEANFVADGYDRANFPDWIKVVNDAQLRALRDQGFDFVRLNIDPSVFFWKPTEEAHLIDQVVNATTRLQSAGLKVVVDMHLSPEMPDRSFGVHKVLGTGGVAEAAVQPYATLLTKIASRLDSLPKEMTALELMNEPDQDWFSNWTPTDRWPQQLGAFYRAAREGSKELSLVLTGARSGGIEGLLRLDPSPFASDANVLWSFHYYEPFVISHSGLPWSKDAPHYLVGLPFPAALLDDPMRKKLLDNARQDINAAVKDAETRSKLKAKVAATLDHYKASNASPNTIADELSRVAKWAADNNIAPGRILLGEFGVFQDKVSMETRASILSATRKAAEDDGFAWAVYTAGLTQPKKSFSIIGDRATLAVEPRIAEALGLHR